MSDSHVGSLLKGRGDCRASNVFVLIFCHEISFLNSDIWSVSKDALHFRYSPHWKNNLKQFLSIIKFKSNVVGSHEWYQWSLMTRAVFHNLLHRANFISPKDSMTQRGVISSYKVRYDFPSLVINPPSQLVWRETNQGYRSRIVSCSGSVNWMRQLPLPDRACLCL